MAIELNWNEGEDQSGVVWGSEAEPLVAATPAPVAIAQGAAPGSGPSRLRLLLLGAGIGVVLGLLALGGLLWWRASQGSQLAQRDVTAAAALLLEAQAAGDVQRYAALLDSADQVWKARLVAGLRNPDLRQPADLVVERVRLDGNTAEAEITVADGQGGTLRRLIYFRLSDGQWRLAPPAPDFFGAEQSTTTPHFRISYRERDQRLVPALVNLAEGAYVALCGELRCTMDSRSLDLRLVYDAQADEPPVTPGVVAVASPSLAGWRPDGQPGAAFTQQLVRQIAVQMALQKAPDASPALLQVIGGWAAAELGGGPSPADEALASALQAERLPSLDRVWDAVVHGNSDDRLFWGSMASVLPFVQSAWGSDAIGLLLEHASGSLDSMTRRAFQIDGEAFQQLWLAWLAQAHTPVPESSTG